MTDSADIALPAPAEEILEETRLKIAIARQHLNRLQEFGMTEAWLNELEAAANEAETIPSFTQQREELKSLTAAKEAAVTACIEWGRKLRYRMQLAFENKPPIGIQFPTQEWRSSEQNESRLIVLFPSLITMAKQHQVALATVGQQESDIEQGRKLLTQLKAANEAQEQYKFSRTTVTAKRRQAFRQLYDGVNRINQMGQMVYGADTADGLQFRSIWRSNSNRIQEPPVTETP
jgi:hypothetical protein